jgi:2,3-bisphosphoglycerate-dependent phosphoglycerate mutase
MAYLVLVRHGESEWNAKSLWTGWTDVSLSDKGREQAQNAGKIISDLHFDLCYTSALKRAKETWDEIRKENHWENVPTTEDKALNERDYGDLTGKNKWKIKEEYGEEQFQKWRRGWDTPPPKGESLKDVYDRVIPYYEKNILPNLEAGKNVIIAAHGNSLRALVKYLDKVPDDKIAEVELGLSEPYVYKIDENGNVVSKEVRSIGTKAP